MEKRALMKKIRAIDGELVRCTEGANPGSCPTDELILTILSQNTNDSNRDRAFASLRSKFHGWAEIAAARPTSIAAAIRVGGLANIKAKRIKNILKQIGEKSSDYSISFVGDMADNDAWDYLMSFDGVGPKTASCVMMFSLGKDFMPVDTHVHRVAGRLGIIPPGMGAEAAHDWFRKLKPPVSVYQLHLNLIQHGRSICRPARPKCSICDLSKYCDFLKGILYDQDPGLQSR
jgi:endonuclease-3